MRMSYTVFREEIFKLIKENLFYSEEEFKIEENEIIKEHQKYENLVAQGNDEPDMLEMSYLSIEELLTLNSVI